jgi:hypothetical protein
VKGIVKTVKLQQGNHLDMLSVHVILRLLERSIGSTKDLLIVLDVSLLEE